MTGAAPMRTFVSVKEAFDLCMGYCRASDDPDVMLAIAYIDKHGQAENK
jgi:hypothetical protein